ncbi:TPA: hypothetical protein ACH3X3_007668 [Trebouxia sp. C0006]
MFELRLLRPAYRDAIYTCKAFATEDQNHLRARSLDKSNTCSTQIPWGFWEVDDIGVGQEQQTAQLQIAIGYTSNLDCALDQDALDSQSHLPKDYTHMEGPSGMIFFTSAVQNGFMMEMLSMQAIPISRKCSQPRPSLAKRKEDTSHDNSLVPTIWKIFDRKCKRPQVVQAGFACLGSLVGVVQLAMAAVKPRSLCQVASHSQCLQQRAFARWWQQSLPRRIAALRAEELKELRYLVKFNKMTSGERVQMF